MSPQDAELVGTAYQFSKHGHAKQRRDDGSRYFDHPKAAAWIYINEFGGDDARLVCVLLLHDMQEDTFLLSPYRFRLNFGLDIALDVTAVTKLPKGKETTGEYMGRIIERGPWAIAGKLFDRLHNLRTLDDCAMEKIQDQIKETNTHHLPKLVSALKEYEDEWEKMADMLEDKMNAAMARY